MTELRAGALPRCRRFRCIGVRIVWACGAAVLVACGDSEPTIPELDSRPSCIAAPEGIVSWWPGDGFGYDVVGPNHVSFENGGTYAPGKVGRAFSFDGIENAAVGEADALLGGLQYLSIEAWVRLNSLRDTEQRLVTLGDEKAVLRRLGDNLDFVMKIDGQFVWISAPSALQPGVFHHVVATRGSAMFMRLFVDGVLVGGAPAAGTVQSTDFLHFSGSDTPLDGLLDEITVYDRVLTPSEIQAIYEAGEGGKCLS